MVGISSRSKAAGSSQSPSLQKSNSKEGQKTLLGFWQKKPLDSSNGSLSTKATPLSSPSLPTQKKTLVQGSPRLRVPVLTPAPSSDAIELEDSNLSKTISKPPSFPSPLTPALSSQSQKDENQVMLDVSYSSPSRRVSSLQTSTVCRR